MFRKLIKNRLKSQDGEEPIEGEITKDVTDLEITFLSDGKMKVIAWQIKGSTTFIAEDDISNLPDVPVTLNKIGINSDTIEIQFDNPVQIEERQTDETRVLIIRP